MRRSNPLECLSVNQVWFMTLLWGLGGGESLGVSISHTGPSVMPSSGRLALSVG